MTELVISEATYQNIWRTLFDEDVHASEHLTQSFSKKRKSHEHHHSRKRHHHHHHAIAGAAVLSITFDALFQQASPTVVRPGFHTLGQDVNMPNKTLSISTSNVSLDLNGTP